MRKPRGLSPSGGNSVAKLLSLKRPRAHRAWSGFKRYYPLRKPRGLSPSGGNSAAKLLSLKQPRAQRARCGVQGGERKTQGDLPRGQTGLPLAD